LQHLVVAANQQSAQTTATTVGEKELNETSGEILQMKFSEVSSEEHLNVHGTRITTQKLNLNESA
jgi:hypothetical protein